ncbi:MAG TPA: hypothetical protein VM286_06735 [Candidatus Thermoplasmatota archaeon]|nr:hypothetical protein [Candidatus Thermoplasmatota archaeon]
MQSLRLFLPALAILLVGLPAAAAAPEGPVRVEAGLHLISVGNYDTAKGTYLMDFYLHLRWDTAQAPANFTPATFEFMNGRAASREVLSDDLEGTVREVWYRIQASLYSPPDFGNYPFDTQRLTIKLEDTVHTDADLVYVATDTTIDDDAALAGWRETDFSALVTTKEYPFGESYARLQYTLTLRREPVSSAMRTFLPPIAFMLVASFSFFFDRSQASNRLGLGTGMLITAVGFHISQTVALPPLGALTLFDKVMIAVYAFIAATLLVTTVLAFGERLHLPERASKLINQRGALLAVAVPFVVFGLLAFL